MIRSYLNAPALKKKLCNPTLNLVEWNPTDHKRDLFDVIQDWNPQLPFIEEIKIQPTPKQNEIWFPDPMPGSDEHKKRSYKIEFDSAKIWSPNPWILKCVFLPLKKKAFCPASWLTELQWIPMYIVYFRTTKTNIRGIL